jgi:hypothetical protein
MNTKKILLASALVIGGSMIATTGYSQVYVNARVGLGIHLPRVYVAPAPAPVVYQDEYSQAPAYQDEYAPAPVYQNGYAPTVVYENEFPGYAYYDYPAWNGHYRDHFYYEHYRPFFERQYAGYFNRGRFDHERFAHERSARGYADRGSSGHGQVSHGGYGNRGGYADRGHNEHGWDHRR